jgi:hypothetical protein
MLRMRSPFVPVAWVLCTFCAHAQGYSSAELERQCLRTVNYADGWAKLQSLPSDAVEMRTAAFKSMPGLNPLRPQPREIWFVGPDDRYLICILGASSGCGQTTAVVSRTASGWSSDTSEITVC